MAGQGTIIFTSEQLRASLAARAPARQAKDNEIRTLTIQGDKFLRNREYQKAVEAYVAALDPQIAQAGILSSLAKAFLKLKNYKAAEAAATRALQFESDFVEPRYRRALARKAMGELRRAHADFQKIAEEDPSNFAAETEAEAILKELRREHQLTRDWANDQDPGGYAWPYDSGDEVASVGSDDEDDPRAHKRACRDYNWSGCSDGMSCPFSHSPDKKSVRDGLGKNVCRFFLRGTCQFGDKCNYSHMKEFLLPNTNLANKPHTKSAPVQRASTSSPTAPGASSFSRPRTVDSNKRPRILLLLLQDHSSFSPMHSHLLAALAGAAEIVEVRSTRDVPTTISKADFHGVLVGDAGIMDPEHAQILTELVEFAKSGGSVVIGGDFGSYIRGDQMDNFFKNSWGFDWKRGGYHRATFSLNDQHELVQRNPSLKDEYRMEALCIKGAAPDTMLYEITYASMMWSRVHAHNPIDNRLEYPAVHARIENGFLGYLGDINAEDESTNTVLAMLGLLDNPHPVTSGHLLVSTSKLPTKSQPSPPGAMSVSNSNAKGSSPSTAAGKRPIADNSSRAGPSATVHPTQQPIQSPSKRQHVLLLLLDERIPFFPSYLHLLSALHGAALTTKAHSVYEALRGLASGDITAVLITDAGITNRANSAILEKLVAFARSGGWVVVGCNFNSFVRGDQMARFFKDTWGLNWSRGAYDRETFVLNGKHELAKRNPSLHSEYSMKAVYVAGVTPEMVVYGATGGSNGDMQAPAVQTRIGSGFLGFLGDVNGEDESTNTILAMLGVLDKPSAPRSAHPSTSSSSPTSEPQSYRITVLTMSLPPLEMAPRPFVIVLSFGNEALVEKIFTSLFDILRNQYEVIHGGLSNQRIVDLLPSPDLKGIIVADPGIMNDENAALLSCLVEHVTQAPTDNTNGESGGKKIIFAGVFPNTAKFDEILPFFSTHWGLQWEAGPYTNTEVTINVKNRLAASNQAKLSAKFTMKALHLAGVTPEMAMYTAAKGSHIYANPKKVRLSAVVYTKVGKGWLGYIGDVNPGPEYDKIMVCMLGSGE